MKSHGSESNNEKKIDKEDKSNKDQVQERKDKQDELKRLWLHLQRKMDRLSKNRYEKMVSDFFRNQEKELRDFEICMKEMTYAFALDTERGKYSNVEHECKDKSGGHHHS
jgi:restriction endonuclease